MAENPTDMETGAVEPDVQAPTATSTTELDEIRTYREEYSARQKQMCEDALKGSCQFLASVEAWDETFITEDRVGLDYRVYAKHDIAQAVKEIRRAKSSSDIPKVDTTGFVIYIHGGGFKVGDLDSEDISCRYLSQLANFIVFSLNYRKAPEHPYPIFFDDTKTGIKAVNKRYLSKLPNLPVIIAGSSAGAHLAAICSQAAASGSLGLKLDATILRCPVTTHPDHVPERFRPYYNTYVTNDAKGQFQGAASRLKEMFVLSGFPHTSYTDGQALPIYGNFKNHPKTYIDLAEDDVLLDDGLCYAMALKEAGVDVKTKIRKGDHTWWLKAYGTDECNNVEADFVQEAKLLVS